VGLIVVAVIVVVAVAVRLYFMRHPGAMRAKCPKCGNVFDASRSFSAFHIGPIKQIKCPACGKISVMRTYVKDPLTWPPEEKKLSEHPERQPSEEEMERSASKSLNTKSNNPFRQQIACRA